MEERVNATRLARPGKAAALEVKVSDEKVEKWAVLEMVTRFYTREGFGSSWSSYHNRQSVWIAEERHITVLYHD